MTWCNHSNNDQEQILILPDGAAAWLYAREKQGTHSYSMRALGDGNPTASPDVIGDASPGVRCMQQVQAARTGRPTRTDSRVERSCERSMAVSFLHCANDVPHTSGVRSPADQDRARSHGVPRKLSRRCVTAHLGAREILFQEGALSIFF